MMDSGVLAHRYTTLRNHLDDLGYRQLLSAESVPLVERLVSDLLHTTESLRHYKELAQKSLEKCSNLELGAEPYRLDNARLVKECNELHLKLLHQEEEAEKNQKELKLKIRKLESKISDLQFLTSQNKTRIKDLELESSQKTNKILQLQSKGICTISAPGGKKKSFPSKPQTTFELDSPLKPGKSWKEQYCNVSAQAKSPYIANMVELADQRIANLNREINSLKKDKQQQLEIIDTFRNQLDNRDREIERLTAMMEGGRPITAIRKDCCCSCKEKNYQSVTLANEVKILENKKKELEQQVKDSIAKQHEAMTRAVLLADRNKKLEQELRDIDQMALAVEAECNNTVKENSLRVSKIQDKLENSLMQIHDLEREVLELKRNNQEIQASMEELRNEKHHLQRKLESALDEKKKNSDRMNEFTIIERGLNQEIERMIQETTLQKRKIAELESQLAAKTARAETLSTRSQKKTHSEKRPKSKSPTGRPGDKKSDKSPAGRPGDKKSDRTVKRTPSPKDDTNRVCCKQYEAVIEKLQAERDFYYNETLRLKEQKRVSVPIDNSNELRRKLNEKEQELMELQQINRDLTKEMEILRLRIECLPTRESHSTMTSPCSISPSATDPTSSMSLKAIIKRLERERDSARGDAQCLEEERDALRERLKIATETQVAEHTRLEKSVMENEERMRKLEAERRELFSTEGSRKATISNLESQLESLHNQLRTAQSELSEQRALYNQIKNLQEQTDRALADSQGKLVQSEMELNSCRERVRQLEKDRAKLDKEVASFKNEVSTLRGTLAQVEQEKDGLLISIDNKTEKTALLEQELKAREDKIFKLEEALAETRKKLSITLDDIASRDTKSRATEHDIETLRRELEMSERAREAALNENRLLHADLANLTEDCRRTNNDLELSRQEVENLKHQLQEYVSEVRRAEDVLSKKEHERSEMLDHFRSLSLEASTLENNNHSLETEMQEARAHLRVANDRITDLEHELEAKETLVKSYEAQIGELTTTIAQLETKICEESSTRRRTEEDLTIVRDLCGKLDTQKENLMQQVTGNDLVKMQDHAGDEDDVQIKLLETELARLRDEHEMLQEQLSKDRDSIQTLENLLSSCRQETLGQKLANQETQAEVNGLRQKVADLQAKLENEAVELRRSQQQAAEFSQQVAALQRTVTNERFERARAEESRRSVISCHTVPTTPSPTLTTTYTGPSAPVLTAAIPPSLQSRQPEILPQTDTHKVYFREGTQFEKRTYKPSTGIQPSIPPLSSSVPISSRERTSSKELSSKYKCSTCKPKSGTGKSSYLTSHQQPAARTYTSTNESLDRQKENISSQSARSYPAEPSSSRQTYRCDCSARHCVCGQSVRGRDAITNTVTNGKLSYSQSSRSYRDDSAGGQTYRCDCSVTCGQSVRGKTTVINTVRNEKPTLTKGVDAILRKYTRDTSASASVKPVIPPSSENLKDTVTFPRHKSASTSQQAIVTNEVGEHTVHMTFISTGPPLSGCTANYTMVRNGETITTTSTSGTGMSTSVRDSGASRVSACNSHDTCRIPLINIPVVGDKRSESQQKKPQSNRRDSNFATNVRFSDLVVDNEEEEEEEEEYLSPECSDTDFSVVSFPFYLKDSNPSTVTLRGSGFNL